VTSAHPFQLRRGFTLIEVVLAIGITIGLMLVVMYFYQQASRLRQDALAQAERVSAARLLLERLTRELRAARPDPFLLMGLRGTSNSLEFVSAGYTRPASWQEGETVSSPASDLNILRYRLAFASESTNALGIARAAEQLLELPAQAGAATETAPPAGQLMTEQLRFLQFRYWDGTRWLESWDALALPRGLEITVAGEPPSEEMDDEDVYRRIVYLPGSEHTPPEPDPFDWFEEEESALP